MRFRIQTVNSEIFTSDLMTEEDFAKENVTEEEAREQFIRIFQHFDDLNYVSLEMNGKRRYFNPKNVVWGEIVD